MPLTEFLYLFSASILAGALNSVAGGGSFFTFPALLFTGISPITANATNTIVVWPGTIASVAAYHKEIPFHYKKFILFLSISSLLGGIIGSFLLLSTPQKTFTYLIPYLLLFATILFTFNKHILKFLSKHTLLSLDNFSEKNLPVLPASVIQFLISIYGGYFGGGMGILMLSAFRFFAIKNIHFANGLKLLFSALVNGTSVVIFLFAKVVAWQYAPLMILGTMIGGYGGAYFAKKVPQKYIYYFISIVGFSLSLYFFIK